MIPLRILLISVLLGSPVMGADASWQVDPTGEEPGTLALWKFDSIDAPGANSALEYDVPLSFSSVGTETGAGVPGKFGHAFRSLADHGDSSTNNDSFAEAKASVSLFSEQALTVDFWFLPEASSHRGTFFDKKRTDHAGIRLFSSRNDRLVLEIGNGERTQGLIIENVLWEPGKWAHLAATFENSGESASLRLYRDGVLLGERVLPGFGNLASGQHPWRIGNRRVAAYASMPGCYDNFRISSLPFQP